MIKSKILKVTPNKYHPSPSKTRSNTRTRVPKKAAEALHIRRRDMFHWYVNDDRTQVRCNLTLIKTPTTVFVQKCGTTLEIELPAFFRDKLPKNAKITWYWEDGDHKDIWGIIPVQEWRDTFSRNPHAIKKGLQEVRKQQTLPHQKQFNRQGKYLGEK